jgi:hypothetical protein
VWETECPVRPCEITPTNSHTHLPVRQAGCLAAHAIAAQTHRDTKPVPSLSGSYGKSQIPSLLVLKIEHVYI